MSETTRVPRSACSACGKMVDSATHGLTGMTPREGDYSICWYCGNVTAFDEGLALRALTDAERAEASSDRELQTLVRLIRQRKALRN